VAAWGDRAISRRGVLDGTSQAANREIADANVQIGARSRDLMKDPG
jgi:hypothetical protein